MYYSFFFSVNLKEKYCVCVSHPSKGLEIFHTFFFFFWLQVFNGVAKVSTDLVSSDDLQTPALKLVTLSPWPGPE